MTHRTKHPQLLTTQRTEAFEHELLRIGDVVKFNTILHEAPYVRRAFVPPSKMGSDSGEWLEVVLMAEPTLVGFNPHQANEH